MFFLGLKLNNEKTELNKHDTEFLGHRISGAGIRLDDTKVEVIQNLPDPKNVTELKRVLGMMNFLRCFIPNMSTILWPDTELLKRDKGQTWCEPQSHAFTKVKEALSSSYAYLL